MGLPFHGRLLGIGHEAGFECKPSEGSPVMDAKFYRCSHCGNLVMMVRDSGVNPVCCGEEMELLVAGSQDASLEKHVPPMPCAWR